VPGSTAKPRGAITLGGYRLVERLGAGGMAEVWRAEGQDGNPVVLKRVLPHRADPQLDEMLAREARLGLALRHPNIVETLEVGEADGQHFAVMAYVEGRDLVEVIRACKPPPGLGAFVVLEVCRALGYAHALSDENGQPLGLVHRDVSPANILVARDGSVRLLDFGIAKPRLDAERTRTVTGVQRGKPGFTAPEQLAGQLDQRADLFAAGAVLHESLTGRRLFRGATPAETQALVQSATIGPPSAINPRVPPELDAICLRALARDPAARYQSAEDMALALEAVTRQLGFGKTETAALLAPLFTVAEDQTSPAAKPRPRARSRRVWWLAPPMVALAALAWWALSRPAPRPSPVAAAPQPVPVEAPVVPMVVPQPPQATPTPRAKQISKPPDPPNRRPKPVPKVTQPTPPPTLNGKDVLKGHGTVDPFE